MISRTGEYALRAIVFLSMNKDSAHTAQQISTGTRVPTAYLSKVLQSLVKAKLVRSQRGCGGGYVLTKPPHKINILEVLNAVDPFQRIRACPLNIKAHGTELCALHKKIDDATAIIERTFEQATIADILASPTKSVPLKE